MIGTTALFAVTALVFALRLTLPRSSGRERLAAQVDLALAPEVFAAIDRRARAIDLGLVVASLAAVVITLPLALGGASDVIVLTTQATAFVLLWALPPAIGALRPFARPADGQRRFARLDRPRLSDYLPPWVTRGSIVTGAAAIAVAAAAVGARPGLLPMVAPGLLCATVTIACVVLLTAGILATRQPAGSSDELLWDDALRALALRGLWAAGFGLSVVAALVALSAVLGASGAFGTVGAEPGILARAAPLVAMLISVATNAAPLPPRWRLHRWPESSVDSNGAMREAGSQ